MDGAHFVGDVAAVLGVGAVTGVIARRLRQPTILGYLFAGLLVGPYLPLPVFADPHRIEALAEFGVVLVMFAVGLEFEIAKLGRVLPTAGLTGLIQVSFLMWCGFSTGQLLGWSTVASIFLGACIAISSTMVVSKVFAQSQVRADVREHVLAILVIQDVVAIVLIAAMTGVAAGGGLGPRDLAVTLAELAGVLLALLVGGLLVVPRMMRGVVRLGSVETDAVVSLGLCFAMALLAEHLGYSVALGAFIAGILVAEAGLGTRIEHLIQPVRDMFAAIFFVSIGMTVDPRQAVDHLPVSLLVTGVVLIAQLTSVSFAGLLSGNGLRRSITAGLSLGQIGEFAFIIAAIGINAGVVPASLQPILVTVAVFTAFTTPLALKLSDRIVHLADTWMPERLAHLIGLHEEWVERIRRGNADRSPPARRAAAALAFDVVALLALLTIVVLITPHATQWLRDHFDLATSRGRLVIALGALVAGAFLLTGAARNALALANLAAESVVSTAVERAEGQTSGAGTVRAMVLLLLMFSIAVPTVGMLGPLVGTRYALLGFGLVIAAVLLYLWRTAGRIDTEYRSAVQRIGEALATGSSQPGVEPRLSNPGLIPGLDHVVTVRLTATAASVGKTLADLDLRARTGATVLTIHRASGRAMLPAGDQRLDAGDLLALTGTEDAIAVARELLIDGRVSEAAEPAPA